MNKYQKQIFFKQRFPTQNKTKSISRNFWYLVKIKLWNHWIFFMPYHLSFSTTSLMNTLTLTVMSPKIVWLL